jgi:hypothetical protein
VGVLHHDLGPGRVAGLLGLGVGEQLMPTLTYGNSTTQYYNVYTNGNCKYYRYYDLYLQNGTGGGSQTNVANSQYVIEDWRLWNTGTASTSIYTSNQIWDQWVTATYTTQTQGNFSQGNAQVYQLREPTEEEVAAQKVAEEKRGKAKLRAKSLLDSMLTPEQRQYVERHGYIPVLGSRGRKYHIRTTGGASGNVVLVGEKGETLARFCAHPTATHDGKVIPTEDAFLAQLLHLQDDEDDFLRKANVNEGQRPQLLVA